MRSLLLSRLVRTGALALVALLVFGFQASMAQSPDVADRDAVNAASALSGDSGTTAQGAARLRQPAGDATDTSSDRTLRRARSSRDSLDEPDASLPRSRADLQLIEPFSAYVKKLFPDDTANADDPDAQKKGEFVVRRFGSELVTGPIRQDTSDGNTLVPADYVLAPGDELLLTLWGSVNADLRLTVDRTGRIAIPRVGTVPVAGVRYADLPVLLSGRVSQVFRNFQLSVSMGQLRAVRVYVTGYVKRPGAYTVTSLSTIVNALLRSGGPSAAGSFRSIELRRGKELVTTFDLYDLLIKGDKTADRIVQADDVVHVSAVGPQVALVGSVNKPAIFEIKPGDTVGDVVQMAGGFNPVADRTRVAVERLDDRSDKRITELSLPAAAQQAPMNGDVLRVFSQVVATLPVARQNKRVMVDGEVLRPGEYVLPANSSIQDALRAAGGLTPSAFVFGTEFTRVSVQRTQQINYDKAVRDLETQAARASSTQRAISPDEAKTFELRDAATARLLAGLRAIKPNGRVVLQLAPSGSSLPALALEDGDRVYVPAKPSVVGVFGSVFNAGSYLYREGADIGEFIGQAGGPTRGADPKSIFVVRANGSVVSEQQKSGWLGFSGGINRTLALAGDTVFVPEEMDKTTWLQNLKEATAIFFQLGVGSAAFKTLGLF